MSGSGGPKQPGDKDRRSSGRFSGAVAGAAAMLFGSKQQPPKQTAGSAPTRSANGTPQEQANLLCNEISSILTERSIQGFLSTEGFSSTGWDLKRRLLELLHLRDKLIDLETIMRNNPGITSSIKQSDIDIYLPVVKRHIEFLSKDIGDPVLDFWIRYGEAVMKVKSESEKRNVDYNSIEVDENHLFISSDLVPPLKYKSPAVIVYYLRRRMYGKHSPNYTFQ